MADTNVVDRPLVVVSNRGPISYSVANGELVAHRGGGGLISGLGQLVDSGQALWIAAALSDADREALATGRVQAEFPNVHMLDIDPEVFDGAYNKVANETLWFIHHGLFNLSMTPAFDAEWWTAWDQYRDYNKQFAHEVITAAPQDAIVLIQDYHLCLLAPQLRDERPDLHLVHFHHTPFGGPESFRVLPPTAREELIASLAAHDICGFHVQAWADQFVDTLHANGVLEQPQVLTTTLSSHLDDLMDVAQSDACATERRRIIDQRRDRQLIVRVDRFELSKNILRGFQAFALLLTKHPEWREQVTFLACCYPSREAVEEYRNYRIAVEDYVASINAQFGTDSWQPIVLATTDNFPRSIAALQLYDVLLVNPIRDGLNLVAKEGPAVNNNDGQLVLSTEAGAYAELHDLCHSVHPFDIAETADVLNTALVATPSERRQHAALLRDRVRERTPKDWLNDQLQAVDNL